jgi:DNA modification methylase
VLTTAYRTSRGVMYQGSAEAMYFSELEDTYRRKVDLIFTSPPFPLNRKKRYGNLTGEAYINWLAGFGPVFRRLLRKTGSIVMELGNAWEPGRPIMSPLALEALLAFMKKGKFVLCQQFIYNNPARLPSPAQWVNVERIRVKDSYTHLWWMSMTDRPEANNRRVLNNYSGAMLRLLAAKKYNAGSRPSQHHISKASFFTDNGGAIPSNVLTFGNTDSRDPYLAYCRRRGLPFHPARMPIGVPEFFVKFLTRPRGLVMDPFAGSNTTGLAAEIHKRRWVSIELKSDYVEGSKGRFGDLISAR